MKVTNAGVLNNIYRRVSGSEAVGAINTSKILYKDIDGNTIFKGGPNKLPLSPSAAIYFQLNDINFAKGSFDGKTINRALDLSVRYWERDHEINEVFSPDTDSGTGWRDNKAFGICGVNPAMKYAFLENFNILESVWSQYYNKGKKSVENCVLSLYDKIYETVIGSPTEMVVDGSSMTSNSSPVGTNLNLFRPRLFVLSPYKYSGLRKLGGGFTNLGKLFEESSTTYFEFLKTKLKPIEYNFFTSPCGDVFIEPDLYDFHPLEFSDKIESRDIIKSEDDVEFISKSYTPIVNDANSTEMDSAESPGQTQMVKVKGKAYFFNSKANHPYFIMEKDRIRNTYEFSVDKIVSAVEVFGSQSKTGGVAESVYTTPENQQFLRDYKSMSEGNAQTVKKESSWIIGRYIADGFDALTSLGEAAKAAFEKEKQDYEELMLKFKNYVFIKLLSDQIEINIGDLILNFAKAINTINPPATTTSTGATKTNTTKPRDYQKNWNRVVQDTVVKYLSTRTSIDESTEIFIVDSFCKELKAAAGIADSVVSLNDYRTKILNKKVSDFLFLNTSKRSNKDSALENLTIEISKLKSKNDTSKKSESNITDSNIDLLIQQFAELGAFSFDSSSSPGASILGDTRGIVGNLVLLYEGTLIGTGSDNTASKMASDLQTLENQSILPRQFRAVTLADLRKLRQQGYYNPRENLISLYGYKRMEPIRNEYIKNGSEANTYARHIFNRILGDSRSINATIIGRPEFQLNRPYYFERKDCIGLLKQYNISFKYGSDFVSTINLGYIRNNTLSYDYSLDELDVICGINNNAYFSNEGKLYLQLQNTLQQTNKLAGQSVGSAVSKSVGGTSGVLLGELTGNSVTDVLNTVQIGGLYSAHDWLGHMNYDDRGNEPVITIDDNISGSLDKLLPPHFATAVVSYCQQIENSLKRLKELENELKNLNDNEMSWAESDLSQIDTEISTKTDESKSSDQATRIKALLELQKLRRKKEKTNIKIKNITSKINSDKLSQKSIQTNLYGLLLDKSRGGQTIIGNDLSLTQAIKNQYALTKKNNMGIYGLFYSLFCTHIDVLAIETNSDEYNRLSVFCSNPDGVGVDALFKGPDQAPSTNFKYYIGYSN
ncbi:MAG: hypothetical protein WC554_10085 [Clostridia bacterium]